MTDSDKQTLISAARRRAKAAARADGESHQSHLERIAREAGREDWGSFLADPVELPEEAAAADAETKQDPDAEYWRGAASMRVRHVVPIQATGALLVLGFLALATDPGRMIELWGLVPGDPVTVLTLLTLVIFGSMIMPAVLMLFGAGIVTFNGLNRNPPKGALSGIWKKVIAYAVTPAVSMFGLMLMPIVLSSMNTSEIHDMQDDQKFLHPIRILESGGRTPVVVLSRTGNIRHVAAIMDQRNIPTSVRRSGLEESPLSEPLRSASVENAVIRLTARLDCTDGSYRFDGLEVAKSVSSPAAAQQGKSDVKWHVLDPVDRDTLCNAPVAAPPSK